MDYPYSKAFASLPRVGAQEGLATNRGFFGGTDAGKDGCHT